jgi:exodeoxyribonuclease VIII
MKPGLHALSWPTYLADPRINWSKLKVLGRSAAHFRHYEQNGMKDTAALKLGRALHHRLFEPGDFKARVLRWDGSRRGRDWEDFSAEHAGKEILTAAEHEACEEMAESVLACPMVADLLKAGQAEMSAAWDYREPDVAKLPGFSMECKGRLDFISEGDVLLDLKTARDASPEGFGRQAFDLGYFAQAAYYSDGYAAITGRHLPFIIIAVEKTPPYVVQPYEVCGQELELGRDKYKGLLATLNLRRREGRWPGYGEAVLPLQLPHWAMPEYAGLGIEFNANGEE